MRKAPPAGKVYRQLRQCYFFPQKFSLIKLKNIIDMSIIV